MAWIIKNIATIIVALILSLIVAGIIVYLIIRKKKGLSSCGCGCNNCPMSESCNKDKKIEN